MNVFLCKVMFAGTVARKAHQLHCEKTVRASLQRTAWPTDAGAMPLMELSFYILV